MGGSDNEIALVTATGIERWPRMGKLLVARQLAERVADYFADFGKPRVAAE
jgi:phosphopantothenoylcysteine decarboxylase/phosphopantothenate--cysteine ligase